MVEEVPLSDQSQASGCMNGYSRRFEYRPEFLFNTLVRRVVDANVPERRIKGFTVARVEDVFSGKDEFFLVFGKPNTALVIPRSDRSGYQKFAAYSIWRQEAHIQDITRDSGSIVQSGIWLRFLDITTHMEERLRAGMEKFEGRKFRTCVRGNMMVLDFAGFTSGHVGLATITWPYQLMRTLLGSGLSFEGKSVRFEVVRTTRLSMEDYTRGIIWAEFTAPWRHYKKNTVVTKSIRLLGSFIPNLSGEHSDNSAVSCHVAPALPLDRDYVNDVRVRVTSASTPGKILRQAWGPHALFEALIERVNIDDYFTRALRPFPQSNPTPLTRLKKRIIFSKATIWFLRKFIGASNLREIGIYSERDVYDMLRTDSSVSTNKYNIVVVRVPATDPGNNPVARLIISRITVGTKFVDWVLSKHVLMSGYLWSPTKDGEAMNKIEACVVWAGECWKTPDGKIVLNGNSGTYQPKQEEDDAMVAMTKKIFPNLTVEKLIKS